VDRGARSVCALRIEQRHLGLLVAAPRCPRSTPLELHRANLRHDTGWLMLRIIRQIGAIRIELALFGLRTEQRHVSRTHGISHRIGVATQDSSACASASNV
jgi:hypothetical protein